MVETVWYKWTAPTNGILELVDHEYFGPTPPAGLFVGDSLEGLEAVPSIIMFPKFFWSVEAGREYRLLLGRPIWADPTSAYYDLPILYSLQLRFHENFNNDNFADRQILTNAVSIARLVLTSEPQEPARPVDIAGGSAWWSWTAQSNGTAQVRLQTTAAGNLSIFAGDVLTALDLVQSTTLNDWHSGYVEWHCEAGKSYSIRLLAAEDNTPVLYQVSASFTPMQLRLASDLLPKAGSDLLLRFENVPEPIHSSAMLAIASGNSVLETWHPPFPSGFTITNVSAGDHHYSLLYHSNHHISSSLRVSIEHPNDDFADRTTLTGTNLALAIDLRGATLEDGEPAAASSGSVWFTWTAPISGHLAFGDFELEIYSGNELSSLARLFSVPALSFDGNSVLPVEAGHRYEFRASEPAADTVHAFLIPHISPAPANDNQASAIALNADGSEVTSKLDGATRGPNEGGTGVSVWYRWTAPDHGYLQIDRESQGSLELYDGVFLSHLSAPTDLRQVTPGTTYFIRHSGNLLDFTALRFSLTFIARPPNDDRTGAIHLPVDGGMAVDLRGASPDADEWLTRKSAWFKWIAPEDGYLYASPNGKLEVWRDSTWLGSVASWSRIYPVARGTTYDLRLSYSTDYDDWLVSLEYGWIPAAPPENDAFENRVTLSGTYATARAQTFLATKSEDDPVGIQHTNTIWFEWIAPADGFVQLNLSPTPAWRRDVWRAPERTLSVLTDDASSIIPRESGYPRFDPENIGSRYLVNAGESYSILIATATVPHPPIPPILISNTSLSTAQHTAGDIFQVRLLFSTINLVTPAQDQVYHVGEEMVAQISEPIAGLDMEIQQVQFTVLRAGGPAFQRTHEAPFLIREALRTGNYSVAATAMNANGDAISISRGFRVVDPTLPHDDFAGRKLLSGREPSYTVTTNEIANLTSEPNEPNTLPGYRTFWLRWIAPADGILSWKQPGWSSGPSGIFTGSSITNLQRIDPFYFSASLPVRRGDDLSFQFSPGSAESIFFSFQSVNLVEPAHDAAFRATEPITFRAQTTEDPAIVDSIEFLADGQPIGAAGFPSYSLTTSLIPAGTHQISTVLVLLSGERVTNQTTVSIHVRPTNSTSEAATPITATTLIDLSGYPLVGGIFHGPPLYYLITPQRDEIVVVGGARLSVSLSGIHGSHLSPIHPSSEAMSETFLLTKGTTYLLMIDSLRSATPRIHLGISPANDAFAEAQPLDSLPQKLRVSTYLATKESWEPLSPDEGSVWYRWTAFESSVLYLSGQLNLSVHYRLSSGDLQVVTPRENGFFPVLKGETYYIQLSGDPRSADIKDCELGLIHWPENDAFENASLIPRATLTLPMDHVGATYESGEFRPYNGVGTLWWKWTAPSDGPLMLSADAARGEVEPRLYTGDSLTNLELVPGVTNRYSGMQYSVQAGTTYFIAMERFSSYTYGPWRLGDFRANLYFRAEPPPNDRFEDRQPLIGEELNVRGTTRLAGREFGEPIHCGTMGGSSVWYTWTAPVDGAVRVEYLGTHVQADYLKRTVAIYRGDNLNELAPVAGSSIPFSYLTLDFNVRAGETYVIAVDLQGAADDFLLKLKVEPPAFGIQNIEVLDGRLHFHLIGHRGYGHILRSDDLVHWQFVTYFSPGGTVAIPIPDSPQSFFKAINTPWETQPPNH